MKGLETRFYTFIQKVYSVRGLTRIGKSATLLCSVPYIHLQAGCVHHGSAKFNVLVRNNAIDKRPNSHSFHSSSVLLRSLSISLSFLEPRNKNNVVSQKEHLQFLPCIQNYYAHRLLSDNVSAGPMKIRPSQKSQQKGSKSPIKEFNFKGKISDHDLNIKMNKIKGLLEKGKLVNVFLKTSKARSSTQNTMPINKFCQKLEESLGTLGKIHKDFSNDAVTRFTLTPTTKTEPDASDENIPNNSKTS